MNPKAKKGGNKKKLWTSLGNEMKKIRIFFDREGNTLDVWFDEPRKALCEETGEEIIIKKDPKTKEVIGFEKLNVLPLTQVVRELPIEVIMR